MGDGGKAIDKGEDERMEERRKEWNGREEN